MEREKITAWITKYALTSGIARIDAEVCSDISSSMIRQVGILYGNVPYHGNDWHRDPVSALARAEEMRLAKIVSVKKKLVKLEKMTFEAKPLFKESM